jgi:hypothetical protein
MPTMELENISISLHSGSVPQCVDGKLDQLYQHMYSSLAYHMVYGTITSDTSTYVVKKNGEIITVLLFRLESGTVRVLNEQFRITAEEIDRFAHYIFNTCPSINIISFPVIDTAANALSFPCRQSPCTQDIVLELPDTAEEYLGSLGKSTRSYIKRYLNKLKRSFPSVSCKTYGNKEISEQHIRDIIALNRARMAGKYKSSRFDDAETEKIFKLARLCGSVSVITIDGRICAGTINYRFGDSYFLSVIAHDPAYDRYGLGTLCCYLTICECIAQNGKEYHFLWGAYEYKFRLGGIQRDLSHLAIYRSRLQLMLNGGTALKLACAGRAYETRNWLLHRMRKKDDSSFSGSLTYHCLNNLKKLKRSSSRIFKRDDNISADSKFYRGKW